jgi:hypothetical protein
MIAAIGAACRMMTSGRLSHSMVREAHADAEAMPTTAHSATPQAGAGP